MLVQREIAAAIRDFRDWFPIVYLGGPRQSGKTTLLRHLLPEMPYTNLEEADTRRRAEEDPRRFLAAFPNGAILDEAQRVADLPYLCASFFRTQHDRTRNTAQRIARQNP